MFGEAVSIATDGALDALFRFYIMMILFCRGWACFSTADLLEKAAQAGSCNDWTWNRDGGYFCFWRLPFKPLA